jgi:hypothetical protein
MARRRQERNIRSEIEDAASTADIEAVEILAGWLFLRDTTMLAIGLDNDDALEFCESFVWFEVDAPNEYLVTRSGKFLDVKTRSVDSIAWHETDGMGHPLDESDIEKSALDAIARVKIAFSPDRDNERPVA